MEAFKIYFFCPCLKWFFNESDKFSHYLIKSSHLFWNFSNFDHIIKLYLKVFLRCLRVKSFIGQCEKAKNQDVWGQKQKFQFQSFFLALDFCRVKIQNQEFNFIRSLTHWGTGFVPYLFEIDPNRERMKSLVRGHFIWRIQI